MADILPKATTLPQVIEGDYVEQYFTPMLLTNESLKSLNIINHLPAEGVLVGENYYKGNYTSVFSFDGSDALRFRKGDELLVAQSWDDLPDPKTADLYLWKAPESLSRDFTYTLEMIYTVTKESQPGGSGGSNEGTTPPVVTEHKLVKTYTQTVRGNWSIWAEQLRSYVYARD